MTHAPAPWWYRLAARLFPKRCREIPEANNPDRIVLRQFAIARQYVYLQSFASGEDPEWFHSHQWRWLLCFVLWGSYVETRLNLRRRVRAPWVYLMGPSTIHQVTEPRAHTSLAIGMARDEDARRYFPRTALEGVDWREHVKLMLPEDKRI